MSFCVSDFEKFEKPTSLMRRVVKIKVWVTCKRLPHLIRRRLKVRIVWLSLLDLV